MIHYSTETKGNLLEAEIFEKACMFMKKRQKHLPSSCLRVDLLPTAVVSFLWS